MLSVNPSANQSSAALLAPEDKHVTLITVPIGADAGIVIVSPA